MQQYLENQNPFYHLQNAVVGGVARHPARHTKRNNNLTKQTPKQRKFCGFVANRFEHQDYDPSKLHKFRASTCGGKPLRFPKVDALSGLQTGRGIHAPVNSRLK